MLPEGADLPIRRVRIMIERKRFEQPIEAGDKRATFEVELRQGPCRLHTLFDDAELQPICGAYYVKATYLGAGEKGETTI